VRENNAERNSFQNEELTEENNARENNAQANSPRNERLIRENDAREKNPIEKSDAEIDILEIETVNVEMMSTIPDKVDDNEKELETMEDAFDRKIERPPTINESKKDDIKESEKSRIGHRHFYEMMGKREQRKDELEKVEGDLRQRLDMLECSMPAVLVWNIWRMSQGAPTCRMKRILEKHFEDTKELSYRCTPSRHYDCRVREIEAERKLAVRKVEEARNIWSEKLDMLEERKKRLEEAKKIQEEQKSRMERLNEEMKILQEETEKQAVDESCRYGECGDMQCMQRWLNRVPSVMSIRSGDIQCLEKLQELAEEEVAMKRDIAELERREETYMRTLQQAEDLWSKIEDDTIDLTLQEQLNMKTAANQRLANRVCELEDTLEKCLTRMSLCRSQLEKFVSIETVEAIIGRDDDLAAVLDKEVIVKPKVVHRPIGKIDDMAMVEDVEVLAKVEVIDEETLAKVPMIDVHVEPVKVEKKEIIVDKDVPITDAVPAEKIRPEDLAEQQRIKEIRDYLAQLERLEDLYEPDGPPCGPDFPCNDVVLTPVGMTAEELIQMGITGRKLALLLSDEERNRVRKEIIDKIEDKTIPDERIVLHTNVLVSWLNALNTISEKAAVYTIHITQIRISKLLKLCIESFLNIYCN